MDPKSATHILYHARCDDGFGAAWAAWKALGDAAVYIPVSHGHPPPEELAPDSRVVIVDFSYARPTLLELKERCADLFVLDHHKTAREELAGLPFTRFDMDRSGAHLAWDFWHPGSPLPDLLAYVEDKDLWRFALPDSKEVAAALRSYPMDFKLWDEFTVDLLKREGATLLRLQEQLVWSACERARWAEVGGHRVPIVNATDFRSEIANRLCDLHPQAPFAAAYYDDESGNRNWSLRSVGDFDVSKLARSLGGGGHKNSAGFSEGREKT
ncbi:MAG: hypothetical protein AB1758_34485 [Candidatus Eremiobacterota bacterium]